MENTAPRWLLEDPWVRIGARQVLLPLPAFRTPSEQRPRVAAQAWARHHAGCGTCRAHDWYSPGAPRIVEEEEARRRVDVITVRRRNGRAVYGVMSPDPSVLCDEGEHLFRTWTRSLGTIAS